MHRLPFLSVLFVVLLALMPARAQSPPSSGPSGSPPAQAATPTQAEELFRQGRAAADALDFKTALDRFTESERLEPAPGTLLNIADCEDHLGKLVSAREHFDLAASGFRRDDARRALAATRALKIEKRLAHLTMRLGPGVPADASIVKSGVVVDKAAFGQSAPADPGMLSIVVNAAGRVHRTYTLELKEGQSLEVTLDVGELASDTAATTTPGTEHAQGEVQGKGPTRRTVGLIVGGVGVAGLAAGGIFGALALGQASTVKSHCDPNYACDQQGVDAASTGKTFALVSTVSLIAGAVLLGAGAYLVLTSKNRRSVSDERPRAGAGPIVVLAPFATPNGGGAATLWAF